MVLMNNNVRDGGADGDDDDGNYHKKNDDDEFHGGGVRGNGAKSVCDDDAYGWRHSWMDGCMHSLDEC